MRFGQEKIDAAIARFPATFGLRGFPGETFRLSPDASYMAGPCMAPTHVMLYTQRLHNGEWLDFAKGTEEELRAQVRSL
jgi:hypothetical protein